MTFEPEVVSRLLACPDRVATLRAMVAPAAPLARPDHGRDRSRHPAAKRETMRRKAIRAGKRAFLNS